MITEENKQNIQKLCLEGLRTIDISKRLNLKYYTVQAYIARNKIPHVNPYKFIDITGKKIGSFIVIEKTNKKYRAGSSIWKCQCECGNISYVSSSDLRRGVTRSCGCKQNEFRALSFGISKEQHRSWKGYGEISGSFISEIRQRAKKKKIIVNLTSEDIWNLFLKQNRRCAFSGILLKFRSKQSVKNGRRDGTASLDRIDSSKDYTIDNVQWVHKHLNIMKMAMPEKDFFQWIKTIYEHKNLQNQPTIAESECNYQI